MTPIDLSEAAAVRALTDLCAPERGVDPVAVYARAVWSSLIEPGDRIAGELVSTLGPVRALEIGLGSQPSPAECGALGIELFELDRARARWKPRSGAIAGALEYARRAGVRLITPELGEWPVQVNDLGPYGPLGLWVRGNAALLQSESSVALVGARAASSYGEWVAADLAAECAASGIAIYSGAAYGIDGAAHAAALAAGGATIAVMAGGVERAYPAGHLDLIDRIAREGVVVADVPCGTSPTKHRFLARNRLIAALSQGTVVVEAGWRSGAQNTAHHAEAIGRPLGVVPGPVTSASSAGCHRLLRETSAVCITGIDDLRELIGLGVSTPPSASGYTGDATRVIDAMSSRTARGTDDIARRAGLAPDEAAAVLGLLELDARVERRAGGWILAPAAGTTLW